MEGFEREDIASARVASAPEVLTDEQAKANGYFYMHKNADGKEILHPCSPVTYGEKRNDYSDLKPGPLLGSTTEEVLKEVGYTDEQIKELESKEVTFTYIKEIPVTY